MKSYTAKISFVYQNSELSLNKLSRIDYFEKFGHITYYKTKKTWILLQIVGHDIDWHRSSVSGQLVPTSIRILLQEPKN